MKKYEFVSELDPEEVRRRLRMTGEDYAVDFNKDDVYIRRTSGKRKWLGQPRLRLRISAGEGGTRICGSFTPSVFVWSALAVFVLAVVALMIVLFSVVGASGANIAVYAFAMLIGVPFVAFVAFVLPMTMYAIPNRAAIEFVEKNLLKS